jgi:hypothetical protein
MPATTITDLINPQVWSAYAQENLAAHSTLQSIGVVEINNSPDIINGDQNTREPKFKPLTSTGDSARIAAATNVALASHDAYAEYGVIVRDAKGWSQEDLAVIVSGANPMQSGMTQFTEYWARQIERPLTKVVQAQFKAGGSLVATHQVDGSGTAFAASKITDGRLLLGENHDVFDKLVVSSTHYGSLVAAGMIDYVDAAAFGESVLKTGTVPVFAGMMVQISDILCPVWTGSVYPMYVMGGQPIRLSYQRPVRLETDRDIQLAAGTDIAVSSVHFAPHVKGCSWSTSGTITATTNPSDAALATAANWERVATNDEDIKLVQILSLA